MSEMIVTSIDTESTAFYTNKLQFSDCEELKESGWKSSVARENVFEELMLQNPISSLADILRILGSTRGGDWQIFRDRDNDFVNTNNLGDIILCTCVSTVGAIICEVSILHHHNQPSPKKTTATN